MSCVHRFNGRRGSFDWEGVAVEGYESPLVKGASVRWLIGPQEKAPHFAMRYFEVEPGGYTSLDTHAHDHGVLILRGRGSVLLGEEEIEVSFGDVVYVSPHDLHQFKCLSGEPLGFLCVVPAKRGETQ